MKANPDILDLLRNKVPDFRYLPISIKEGIAIERSLRSCLESHNFLTWSVMALIHFFMRRYFCLRTIQLSPSCRSPFPRSVAVWLLPHLQMLPSSPEEEIARLWSLLALRLMTCPYLSHILRPPRRRHHLVVHHILALWSREALLDNFS